MCQVAPNKSIRLPIREQKGHSWWVSLFFVFFMQPMSAVDAKCSRTLLGRRLLGGRLSRRCSIKKCNGVMPSRLLLFWCLAPCVSCTHQPEDVLDPGGLRALLTCSELRSDLSRTEAQLALLQQQVDALKHVRDDVSQRLHLCEAQAHIGDTTSQMSSSSPGESVSDTHQNEKCLVGVAPDGRSRGEETGAFTEDRIGRQAPID